MTLSEIWGSSSRFYYPIDTLSNALTKRRFPQLKSRFEPENAKIVSSLPMDIDYMKRIDDRIREFVDYKLMFA